MAAKKTEKPLKPWEEDAEAPVFWETKDEIRERKQRRQDYLEDLFLPMSGLTKRGIDWLVQDFIPDGYLALLAAPPKAGKTCLATAIAIAVATGTDFAGRAAQQGAVLWIAGEESPLERSLILAQSPLVDDSTPIYTCFQMMNVDDDNCLACVSDWISRTHAKLIVVDPLIACIAGGSLTDSWQARKSLRLLKDFCARMRITALVLHHTKRGEDSFKRRRVADSSQLSATSSMNIVMNIQHRYSGGENAEDPAKESRVVTLQCDGRGLGLNVPIQLVSHGPLDYRGTDAPEAPAEKEWIPTWTEAAVLEALQLSPMDSEQILSMSGIGTSTARNAITDLRRMGKIVILQTQGRRRIYGLPEHVEKLRNSEIEIPPNDKYFYEPMTVW